MGNTEAKLRKIDKVIQKIQAKNEWVSRCVPIVIDLDYKPQYNDKGELLPPPILGGLSISTTPHK